MLFVEHDQMIGTLTPDRPDQSLNTSILPGCAERGGAIPDAVCTENLIRVDEVAESPKLAQ
jgi:hypothetical protein